MMMSRWVTGTDMDEGESSPPSQPSPVEGEGVFLSVFSLLRLDSGARERRSGVLPCFVGEAVADQVLCCFHAVADFDAGGLAAHCFREEARDVFTVFGEAVNLVLYVCWVAHISHQVSGGSPFDRLATHLLNLMFYYGDECLGCQGGVQKQL